MSIFIFLSQTLSVIIYRLYTKIIYNNNKSSLLISVINNRSVLYYIIK